MIWIIHLANRPPLLLAFFLIKIITILDVLVDVLLGGLAAEILMFAASGIKPPSPVTECEHTQHQILSKAHLF